MSVPNLSDLLTIAKTTVKELQPSEQFIVRDLFRGFEWNRIQKGDRTRLGAAFHVWALAGGKSSLKPLGKTPQNQQIYEKL
jgi:hypothetical protein